MVDAPRQDWDKYKALTRQDEVRWLQQLGIDERFAIYDDAFNIIWGFRRDADEWTRLEQSHWEQKSALRMRLVRAYNLLDQSLRESAAANYSR
jgi:hypothetical protein